MENVLGFLTTTAKIVAIPAFLISLWNLLGPYMLKLKMSITPETQIQIAVDSQSVKPITGFNVLFTIFTKGPSSKWDSYKFMSADIKVPDGRTLNFGCRTYLAEKNGGQSNDSRNIPIAINGSQSKITTAAFQSSEYPTWQVGAYSINFNAINSKRQTISSSKMTFELDEKLIAIINQPKAILTIQSEVSD